MKIPKGFCSSPGVVCIDSGGHRQRVLARRDALVEAHAYLVPPIALRIAMGLPPSFDIQDLTATGYLALVHVATRYRPRLHGGTPFSAFARPRIRGAILDSIRRRHWEENTRPALDDVAEPAIGDRSIEINTAIDEERLHKRLALAIGRLPTNPRGRLGHFLSLAAALADLGPEWAMVREHADAIAKLRRGLRTG